MHVARLLLIVTIAMLGGAQSVRSAMPQVAGSGNQPQAGEQRAVDATRRYPLPTARPASQFDGSDRERGQGASVSGEMLFNSVPGWKPEGKASAIPNAVLGFNAPNGNVPPSSASNLGPEASDARVSTPGLSLYDDECDWWTRRMNQTILPDRRGYEVSLDQAIHWFLANSPVVVAISQEPLIREAEVIESRALFDPAAFVDSKFSDRNDPVGNLLLTDDNLLQEHIWSANAGLRKRLQTGGSIELSQRFGFQNSNARFFFPQDQGTATLTLNYRQPLLRGAGGRINRSQIILAQIADSASWDRFSGELQAEMLKLIQAYWNLYYSRSVLLQKQRNVERSAVILGILEGRQELDSLPSQIARARAAVASRSAELANAERDVLNAETEMRRILADVTQAGGVYVELIPTDLPQMDYAALPLEEAVHQSLHLRPEIAQAMKRVESVATECQVAKNQLLPALTMLFEAYTSGLAGETGIDRAWWNQFASTVPGYIAGLEFEVPLGNRVARSQLQQRRLQLARAEAELQAALQAVVADVQIASRTRDSAFETLQAAAASIEAARGDLNQQTRRWEAFALIEGDVADGVTPTTLLDQLLESQQRLTAAELVYSRAVADYQSSQAAVHRAAGTLLIQRKISTARSDLDGLPRIDVYQDLSR